MSDPDRPSYVHAAERSPIATPLIAYSTDHLQRGRSLGGADEPARQHYRRGYTPAPRGWRSIRLASDWAVLSYNHSRGNVDEPHAACISRFRRARWIRVRSNCNSTCVTVRPRCFFLFGWQDFARLQERGTQTLWTPSTWFGRAGLH